MASETGFNHSDGVKLREYFETTCEARREVFDARLDAFEKGLELYQSLQSVRQEQAQSEHNRVLEDIKSLRESRAELAGKANQESVTDVAKIALRSQVIAASSVFLGIISLIVSVLLHQ